MSIKTYITYFDDRQIDEFNLKADENTILFKGNDTNYEGISINHLNTYYCELCTLYYVWKNDLRSDYVVFKQYRRPFEWESVGRLPDKGEVITYEAVPMNVPVIMQYAICHGSKRTYDIMNIIKNCFGDKSQVVDYFINHRTLYTNNSMVLKWDDFVKMCEFVFDTLDAVDEYYKLDYKPGRYALNANKYTEDGKDEYQKHWMAYIGERLVSCYITLNLKPITIPRLENNGFYKPYK